MFKQIMFGRSYEKDKPPGVTSMVTLETSPVEGVGLGCRMLPKLYYFYLQEADVGTNRKVGITY